MVTQQVCPLTAEEVSFCEYESDHSSSIAGIYKTRYLELGIIGRNLHKFSLPGIKIPNMCHYRKKYYCLVSQIIDHIYSI